MNFRKHLVKGILEGTITHVVVLNKPKEVDYCSLACSKCHGYFKITEVVPRTMVSFTNEEAQSYGYPNKASMLIQAQQRGDLSYNDSKTPVYLCKIELLNMTENGKKLLQPKVPKKRKKPKRKVVIAYWKGKCPKCSMDYMKLKKHWKIGKYYVCELCGYKEKEYGKLTSKDLQVIDSKGNRVLQFCQRCGKAMISLRRYPKKTKKGYYAFCRICRKKSHDIQKPYLVVYR